jgi:hypothetical protein
MKRKPYTDSWLIVKGMDDIAELLSDCLIVIREVESYWAVTVLMAPIGLRLIERWLPSIYPFDIAKAIAIGCLKIVKEGTITTLPKDPCGIDRQTAA